MERTTGTSSSLCVCAKNWQILVHGEWYANCLRMVWHRFAVPSTHTCIWFVDNPVRSCIRGFMRFCCTFKKCTAMRRASTAECLWSVSTAFLFSCIGMCVLVEKHVKLMYLTANEVWWVIAIRYAWPQISEQTKNRLWSDGVYKL